MSGGAAVLLDTSGELGWEEDDRWSELVRPGLEGLGPLARMFSTLGLTGLKALECL